MQETGNVFDNMGLLWAEIADKHYTERQIRLLTTQLRNDRRILDVACGTGRHTIALSKKRFKVVGIDISLNLLKIAKNHGASLLVRGDLRFLPFKSEAFGAVISMDNSFGYLRSEDEDQQSLVEVRRVLQNGGRFLLDVFNREELLAKYKEKSAPPQLYEYPSFQLKQKRNVSPDGRWLCDYWTIYEYTGRVRVFRHKAHLYPYSEFKKMLNNSRFTIEAAYGDYERQPYSASSKRLITVSTAN